MLSLHENSGGEKKTEEVAKKKGKNRIEAVLKKPKEPGAHAEKLCSRINRGRCFPDLIS